VDSVSVGAVSSHTFDNIGANHNVSVTFTAYPATAPTGMIYINDAWLSGKTAPYILNTANTTYVLRKDITVDETAFVFGAANVILDLNQHTITYGNSIPMIVANGDFEILEIRRLPVGI
jgi:hypothetical protein